MLLSNYIDPDDSMQIQTSAEFTRLNVNADGSTGTEDAGPLVQRPGLASIALGAGITRVSPGSQFGLLWRRNITRCTARTIGA